MPKGKRVEPAWEEEFFEVEQILSKRVVKGSAEYLIKWKGYGEEEATWEAAANIASILDMVLEFEKQPHHAPAAELKPANKQEANDSSLEPALEVLPIGQCDPGDATESCAELTEQAEHQQPEDATFAKNAEDAPIYEENLPIPNSHGIRSNPRVLNNSFIDIAREARRVEEGFQKLAEKAKVTKKQQKMYKRQEKYNAESRKSRCFKKQPTTELIMQNQKDFDSDFAFGCYRMQLRERKEPKPKEANAITKAKYRQRRDTQKNVKEEPLQNQLSEQENAPTQLRTQSKPGEEINIKVSEVDQIPSIRDNENTGSISAIRMLECQPNQPGEYLVQYDSGAMKILSTVDLILYSPLEFAAYLDKKRQVA